MKRFLILLLLLLSVKGFAQYNLGKSEKEIRNIHKGDSIIKQKAGTPRDSVFLLQVFLPGTNRLYYIDTNKDSCTIEVVAFTNITVQENYMKELNNKWIGNGDQKWKMYFGGTTVCAEFTRIAYTEYDVVLYFRLK